MTNISLMIGANGAIVPALVSVSQPQRTAMNTLGMPIPQPAVCGLLLDTGASLTAIDNTIIVNQGLVPTGLIFVNTAGGALPVPALTYAIGLLLPSTAGPGQTYFPALPISSIDIAPGAANGLLGRDVLAFSLMTYAGFANTLLLTL
jgi:hypothetical protein